jgi:hypothetical protein
MANDSASDWRSAEDEKRPSTKKLSNANGKDATGTAESKGRKTASDGRGLRTKEQHKTNPSKPGGRDAAIEIAIGPEKDSPRRTNGWSFGRNERAIGSSSE